ncbi:MAG: agglutinin biogenesis protein MshI [Burkholderiales bacterium]
MVAFLKRPSKRESGWLAIALGARELRYVHGRANAGKTTITRCGTQAFGDDKELQRVARDLGFERYQRLTVLPPADYQLLLVDAPNVPASELKNAARWRVKDMLDYPVEQATVDIFDVPPDPAGASQAHTMYAAAAKNDVIRSCMERFTRARMPLSVIDIEETAQRNIAAQLESSDRGLALIYPADDRVLLTVNFRGELYLARRIDVALHELEAVAQGTVDDPKNRVLLEVQRSFDHLERQFPSISVAKVLIAPTPADTDLHIYLGANLDVPVEELQLEDVLDIAPDIDFTGGLGWQFFHLLGATLREPAKAS